MTNLKPTKKKLSQANRKVSINSASEQLAEFFNGVVVEFEEEYINDK